MTVEHIVDLNGNRHDLTGQVYFHWADKSSILLHNAKIGRGLVVSISALAAHSGIAGFTTAYAAMNSEKAKEGVWEAVRQANYDSRPSRDKAFFCFENSVSAEIAKRRWFPEESKILLEVRATVNAVTFSADSQWLNRSESEWEAAAHNYWMGREAPDSLKEVIVFGCIYFPNWESFPLLGS